MPCSVTSQRLGSAGTPGGPVPVRSFTPLAPLQVVSPLQFSQFEAELGDYPDQAAAAYVVTGLRKGFRTGFEASSVSLRSVSANMSSGLVHPSVIDAYLESEVSRGRMAGPFTALPCPELRISRFGVIPKNNQHVQWRLILDLSSPKGHSVNNGIPKPLFSVHYVTVDFFIEGIMAQGRELLWPSSMWRAPTAMWPSIRRIVPSWG